MLRAREGAEGRLWIVAGTQSKGRGRNGRNWVSPRGNLHASLLLIDPAPAQQAPELGFVCGLAAHEALQACLKGDAQLAIKWPNDILHAGAKLAGLLLESTALPNRSIACVAGIGINCCQHPEETPYPATDLSRITGEPIAPETVFDALASAMAGWLAIWAHGTNFAAIRAEWMKRAKGIGEPIIVQRRTDRLSGIFETIDAGGRLILRRNEERISVEAGDVFFAAPSPGSTQADVMSVSEEASSSSAPLGPARRQATGIGP